MSDEQKHEELQEHLLERPNLVYKLDESKSH